MLQPLPSPFCSARFVVCLHLPLSLSTRLPLCSQLRSFSLLLRLSEESQSSSLLSPLPYSCFRSMAEHCHWAGRESGFHLKPKRRSGVLMNQRENSALPHKLNGIVEALTRDLWLLGGSGRAELGCWMDLSMVQKLLEFKEVWVTWELPSGSQCGP